MYNVQILIDRCSSVPYVPVLTCCIYTLLVRRFGTGTVGSWAKTKLDEDDLTFTLRAWNAGLLGFSAWGVAHTYPHLLSAATFDNCAPAPTLGQEGRAMGLFALSKFVELGDTFFLVIRGKSVRTIHSFHHASVLLLTWYLFVTKASIGPAFVAMNYLVHVMLYLYYVVASLPTGVKAAKACGPIVTGAQIAQMVFGFAISLNVIVIKITRAKPCDTDLKGAVFALVIYSIYLFMFTELWVKLYGVPWAPKKRKPT